MYTSAQSDDGVDCASEVNDINSTHREHGPPENGTNTLAPNRTFNRVDIQLLNRPVTLSMKQSRHDGSIRVSATAGPALHL